MDTSRKIYSVLGSIYYSPYIQNELAELDIEPDIKVIDEIIQQIKSKEGDQKFFNKNRPIFVALKYLNDITEKIHEELSKIENELKYHKTKWFHTWRNPNCHKEIDNLRKYKKLMKKRLDTLIISINCSNRIS